MQSLVRVLFTVAVLLLGMYCSTTGVDVGGEVPSFALAEYQEMIDLYPSDVVLGPILNAEDAKKQAEEVWLEEYGEYISNLKPYEVFFDGENQVWLVHGSLPEGWWGGFGYILMEKENGKVLAVWFTQ